MGNNLNRIYNKAMDYYQNGEVDKALKKCEEGIAESLNDSNLLNLKGLLLYIKGDLNGALTTWGINKDFNDDEIAKVYIRDAKNDDTKLNLYECAQVDIKNLRIDEAIEKLEKCASSDFNSINVNTVLALCYLRKGNCIMANEYIEKALGIDKNNQSVQNVKMQLDNFYADPKDEFSKKIFKVVSIIVVLGLVGFGTYKAINSYNNSKPDKEVEVNKEEISDTKVDETKDEIVEKVEEVEENKYTFTTKEEIQQAYIEGTNFYKEEKYDEAKKILSPAYESEIQSYLKNDILYLLALSCQKNNEIEECLNYYEEYAKNYSNKSYIKEVYYNLAILFDELGDSKSKTYAQIIANEFSNTIYYNNNIKRILR